MGKVVGIDIGGSTTKIVGFKNGQLLSPTIVKATDPVASVYGAFGKFLNDNKLVIHDIEKVVITGVGASFINEPIFGIPTEKIDELVAIGSGGLFLSGLSKALVVSMGTGTAYILADGMSMKHIGGTGVGGGTLLGLSNRMLNIRSFDDLVETARDGELSHIDLNIGDLTKDNVGTLPLDSTASNFGKISDLATRSDVAMGIINLVFQTIGMMAIFAVRNMDNDNIVLTGNLTNVPQSREVFRRLEELFGVRFHIPINAEYATAAGAAIASSGNLPVL